MPFCSLFCFQYSDLTYLEYTSGLLEDSFALCMACKQTSSSLLSLMDAYRKELDYTVLSRMITVRVISSPKKVELSVITISFSILTVSDTADKL